MRGPLEVLLPRRLLHRNLSSIGASHGELTVSAMSVETVPHEGYCDGAAVLSIDEVLGSQLLRPQPPLSARGLE